MNGETEPKESSQVVLFNDDNNDEFLNVHILQNHHEKWNKFFHIFLCNFY